MQNKNKLIDSIKRAGTILNTLCKFYRAILFLIPVAIIAFTVFALKENLSFFDNIANTYYVKQFSYHSLNVFRKFIYIKTGIKGLLILFAIEFTYAVVIGFLLFDRLYRLLNLLQESASPFNGELVKHIRITIILLVAGNISRPLYAVFIFLVGYCLLKVFEYGIFLQYESDETV